MGLRYFLYHLIYFQSILNGQNSWTLLIALLFFGTLANESLPSGVLTNLISQGIIPGIGGILIFIPQIAFLFLFISILEEWLHESVVFLMDKIMRKFGLSGKVWCR
jgi:ferrous iron transport protein B